MFLNRFIKADRGWKILGHSGLDAITVGIRGKSAVFDKKHDKNVCAANEGLCQGFCLATITVHNDTDTTTYNNNRSFFFKKWFVVLCCGSQKKFVIYGKKRSWEHVNIWGSHKETEDYSCIS